MVYCRTLTFHFIQITLLYRTLIFQVWVCEQPTGAVWGSGVHSTWRWIKLLSFSYPSCILLLSFSYSFVFVPLSFYCYSRPSIAPSTYYTNSSTACAAHSSSFPVPSALFLIQPLLHLLFLMIFLLLFLLLFLMLMMLLLLLLILEVCL